MIWWAVLIIWLIGVGVALFLIEKEDREFWVRHGYSGSALNRVLEAYMWAKVGISLLSWFAVSSVLRVAAENKRIAKKVDEATKEMNETIHSLQEALERLKQK